MVRGLCLLLNSECVVEAWAFLTRGCYTKKKDIIACLKKIDWTRPDT